MFSINDPMIQRALTEPANLGYIKNVLGLTELVIPGEESAFDIGLAAELMGADVVS